MNALHKLPIFICAVAVAVAPLSGYCLESQSSTSPLLQKLREGKATLSINKKSILDDQGKIVANLIPTPVTKGGTSVSKPLPICNPVCAIVEKQCYADMTNSVICINVCKKELFKCE